MSEEQATQSPETVLDEATKAVVIDKLAQLMDVDPDQFQVMHNGTTIRTAMRCWPLSYEECTWLLGHLTGTPVVPVDPEDRQVMA